MAKFTRALRKSRETVNLVRGLRFRLAAGFLLFFTLLLLVLGILFRQMLVDIVDKRVEELTVDDWGAVKGYLRIEHQRARWFYDRYDPEEAIIVDRIQTRVYLLTDDQGNIIEASELEKTLGIDSSQIQAKIKRSLQQNGYVVERLKNNQGEKFLVRYGMIPDREHHVYLLLIGRSLADNERTVSQFTWQFFAVVPLIVLLCGSLGWVLAGSALKPVIDVAHTAQRITGSNLNVQIPTRGAGDELDHLIKAFNRMVERLNLSFEQTRRFSTDVSHELRTPLTAIRGQLEVALFTAETTDQYRDAMVNALQDVEQLSNIVRALLMLSQAESGQLALQMSPVNFADVIRDMVDQFQIPAEEAGITLTVESDPDVTVHADRTQLERLVANLLSNAIKYTQSGGAICAGVREENGSAVFWVQDNGIGIPAEKLPHIFDRFFRVRPSQSNPVQGLGLGLSFVAWIVNAHAGKIEVDSTEEKGTRFTVTLPLHRPETPAEAQPSVTEQTSA